MSAHSEMGAAGGRDSDFLADGTTGTSCGALPQTTKSARASLVRATYAALTAEGCDMITHLMGAGVICSCPDQERKL